MPKRKSEDIEGQKHRGPTLLTYFPTVSRPDSNSEGSERRSQSVGNSDSSETVDKSASEHPKEPSAKTTDENRHFQDRWLNDHSWLQYDKEKNLMTCSLCIKHKNQFLNIIEEYICQIISVLT